jgi:hypothetical protein
MGLKGTSGTLDKIGTKDGILLRLVLCSRFVKFDLVEFWNWSRGVRCMDIPLSGSENGLG